MIRLLWDTLGEGGQGSIVLMLRVFLAKSFRQLGSVKTPEFSHIPARRLNAENSEKGGKQRLVRDEIRRICLNLFVSGQYQRVLNLVRPE